MIIKETVVKALHGFGFTIKESEIGFQTIIELDNPGKGTMVENGKKRRQNSHLIIHCPTSEEVSEVSERVNE